MKKYVLIFSLIICMLCAQAAHADQFELTVDRKSALPGEEVCINLTFSNNTGIIAALFEIEYDKERLELIKAEDKRLLKGGVFSETYDTYPYIMVWNSSLSKNIVSDGALAELTFRVRENAKGGNAFIDVSYNPINVFDANLKKVDIRINNGSITVLGENTEGTDQSGEETKNDETADNNETNKDEPSPENDTNSNENDTAKEETANKEDTENADNHPPEDATSTKEDINNNDSSTEEEQLKDETNPVINNYHSPSNNSSLSSKDNTTAKSENEPQKEDTKPEASAKLFEDVSSNDWFYDAVEYVSEIKLMKGLSDSHFAPHNPLTRAMLVTVIYRCEGAPHTTAVSPFSDVMEDAYYAKAVAWAFENGIVNGYSKSDFAPDINITREQMASVIHRYAVYKGYDSAENENSNISSFSDYSEISEYAVPAVQYVSGVKIMNGKSESLFCPKDNASRAETAAILQRFIENNRH